MWPFSTRAKLLRALDALAFYNDKGIAYSRHSAEQVSAERTLRTARVGELALRLKPSSLPPSFLDALDSGAVATDLTGKYVELVKGFG